MDSPTRSFVSSKSADVWHDLREPRASEVWCYCAISDDGDEFISAKFHDNYRASPRFYSTAGSGGRVPAVEFSYVRKRTVVARAFCEFNSLAFQASNQGSNQVSNQASNIDVALAIGDCSISGVDATYGNGHVVKIELPLTRSKRLNATFEWLSVECDLAQSIELAATNIVTPRADVSGRVSIISEKREQTTTFRGTGTHSHEIANGEPVSLTLSGFVHFTDATALIEVANDKVVTVTLLADSQILSHELSVVQVKRGMSSFGLRYPREVLCNNDGLRLEVSRRKTLSSTAFGSAFLCDVLLEGKDGKIRRSSGIFESTNTRRMRHSFWRIISGLSIQRL